MKKIEFKGHCLIGMVTLCWLLAPAIAQDVHAFKGEQLSDLKRLGYTSFGGFCVRGTADDGSCNVQLNTWCRPLVGRQKLCVYGIEIRIGVDANGRPVFRTEDAFEYQSKPEAKWLDADQNCKADAYPTLSVVAIGSWHWRNGSKAGGYASSIKRAWIIDSSANRFKEIPATQVTCEIDDDRD